jgi:FkbM family methyltransferase
MKSYFSPTPPELEALAAERPLATVEAFKPNDFYGHATVLKRYAGLPETFAIRAVMPHGPSFCHKLWDTELKDPCPTILAISDQQRALYQEQCPHKRVTVIGSPVLYAARLMEDELSDLRARARGTIVFPTHSTHHVTVEFDHPAFIDELRALPDDLQPVRVCLYWRDIQLERHLAYQRAGLACVTAGHMFDPEFVPRVLRLLSSHRHAIANKLGSCVYYAAALGLPVELRLQATTYSGPNPAQLAELSPDLDLPAAVRFAGTADLSADQAAPIQKQVALAELGATAVLSPDNLRRVLEQLPPNPAARRARSPARAPTESSRLPRAGRAPQPPGGSGPGPEAVPESYLIDATTNSLAQQLRPLVAGHPRRVPGKIKLNGRPFAFADLHSLYHQAQQIFGQKLYDFAASNGQPVIIDGGAHIGLASLFFARRYPGATIHAFEADPAIAALLASNTSALGLRNVQVHAQALWTSTNGVAFATTADDSGHVTVRTPAPPAQPSPSSLLSSPRRHGAATIVPSVRLRDLLEQETVDLLKLDIEGAEFAVLRDCDGALRRVRNILIEVHRFRDSDGHLGELLAVLERNGFNYALGDLHAATWIESPSRPPFTACASRHFIVTVFAWNATPPPQPHASPASRGVQQKAQTGTEAEAEEKTRPRPRTIDTMLREGVAHLNARRNNEALRCFEAAVAAGARGVRPQYGRSLALARLGRKPEALRLLDAIQREDPTHAPATALANELAATPDASADPTPASSADASVAAGVSAAAEPEPRPGPKP